ncbi:hypothetical protein M878_21615 [Streptomyces roseochromogenus subsp. oscitans DS 12.976]|uniref:asparagine synthase (glutamine-hydrolyzing) n=2 Tax=Streptomyces roseochromogenus TaxID=285450 RepID=V6KAC7_STRRC|nr:hypothetical protein M878_21615 [Streptomyces roseochromogenus subsp. oscitans DS 12.976]
MAVSGPGRFRLRGTASGLRRVYTARMHGITVAADRADILADLSGADLDERWLAVRLITGGPPHLLDGLTAWQGVFAVPPGDALTVGAHGGSAHRPWWSPPLPDRPVETGAAALRAALAEAVALRIAQAPESAVGCDLSGGMDSTALAFLASAAGASLHTMTLAFRDPANDDTHWANLARSHLPDTVALSLADDELPGQYENLGEPGSPADAPSGVLRGRAVFDATAARYRGHGVVLQLAGHGGDEVLQTPPGYLGDLLPAHPLLAVRHLRGHRSVRRWPLSLALRGLVDRRSYPQWLRDQARRLRGGPPTEPSHHVPLGWGPPVRMAPWATRRAALLVADLLEEAATTALPLAADRGQHQTLHRLRAVSQLYRLMRQEYDQPWMGLPFLDDRVVEACLAVRTHERGTPFAYKPLLARAMHGLMPGHLLARATKGSTDTDFYAGLREQRAALNQLVERSRLAQAGLLDAAALGAALHTPVPRISADLEDTLVVEHWLHHGRLTLPAATPSRSTVRSTRST